MSHSDRQLTWLQVEVVGQLSTQMAEMVGGGAVETVGEEPESEGILEQREEDEEEHTKVSLTSSEATAASQHRHPETPLHFPSSTGRGGNANPGAGALLSDAIAAAGGGHPFH